MYASSKHYKVFGDNQIESTNSIWRVYRPIYTLLWKKCIYRSIGLLYSCENKCVRMVVFLGGGGYPRIAITGRIPWRHRPMLSRISIDPQSLDAHQNRATAPVSWDSLNIAPFGFFLWATKGLPTHSRFTARIVWMVWRVSADMRLNRIEDQVHVYLGIFVFFSWPAWWAWCDFRPSDLASGWPGSRTACRSEDSSSLPSTGLLLSLVVFPAR